VAGLITIEDVLEQIVGDIEDEHDFDEDEDNIVAVQHEPGRYRVKAITTLEQFNETFHSSLSDEQVDTIGGYVTDHLGRVPHKGETLVLDGFEIEIQRADARTVQMLLFKRLEDTTEAETNKPSEDAGLAS